MQNRSKIGIFDGKNLYSGVKSWGGALPPHQNLWGGIRPPCPPASYAYAKTSDVTHTKVEWIGQVLSHKSRRARRFGAESTKIEIETKNLEELE